MLSKKFEPNALYFGDCLEVMQEWPDECVDLICLDPPFNSNAQYNNIFKGRGLFGKSINPQIKAYEDIWTWNDESVERLNRVKNAHANPASAVIKGFEAFIPKSRTLSYASYMAERLYQTHRILKPTGTIYLHCDPTASHYLKLIMDALFGKQNFRNEIIWHYSNLSATKRHFPRKHDTIFRYTKSNAWTFNHEDIRVPYSESSHNRVKYKGSGFAEKSDGSWLNEKGKIPDTVWDIPLLKGKERIGYPTQKPIAVYDRIVKASSIPGDVVLDPFCGCGTTVVAALQNGRHAVGIDIYAPALNLINDKRVAPMGASRLPVKGTPNNVTEARMLHQHDPYQFQDWAVGLIPGLAPNPNRSRDGGVDGAGVIAMKPENSDLKGIVVQVTGSPGSQIQKYKELQTTMLNNDAAMGIFITLQEQRMRHEWKLDWASRLPQIHVDRKSYDPIQCFSIEEYFRNDQKWDAVLDLPLLTDPYTGKTLERTLFNQTP